MSATPETKKRLALAIIDFLSSSLKDGTLSSDSAESVEIAQSCIADVFQVDPQNDAAMKEAIGSQSLLGIYSVYEKLKTKQSASTPPGGSSAAEARPSTPSTAAAGAATKGTQESESLKSKGNAAMQAKDYPAAIDFYTQAIALSKNNPIYLSNRAAAYSAQGKHAEAAQDAEAATQADPKYTKGWSRLGLARFALGDTKGSIDAYTKGIDHEGSGGSPAMKKGLETAKAKLEEEEQANAAAGGDPTRGIGGDAPAAGGMPDLSALAGMLGGGGGRGGGGGPDFSSIMNNPMFASMAQNLMSNPEMMNNIMSNPRLREMAENFGGGGGGGGGSGGGMPDMASLMSDPSIAEMARNLMGGGRGRGGAGPPGGP